MNFILQIRGACLVMVLASAGTGVLAQSAQSKNTGQVPASAGPASAPASHPIPHRLDPAILAAIQRSSQALLHAQQEPQPSAQASDLPQTLQSLQSDVHQYLVKHAPTLTAEAPSDAGSSDTGATQLRTHLDHLRRAHDELQQTSDQASDARRHARIGEFAAQAQRIHDELDRALSASTAQERAARLAQLDARLTPENLHGRVAHLSTHPQVAILADGAQIESGPVSDTPTPDKPITTFSKRTDINDTTVERSRRSGRIDARHVEGKQDAHRLAPASNKQTNGR